MRRAALLVAGAALLATGACARQGDTTASGKAKIPEKEQPGVTRPDTDKPKDRPRPPG